MPTTTLRRNEEHLLGGLHYALKALEQTAGVKGRVVDLEPRAKHAADALIELDANGQRLRYFVEAKAQVDRLAVLGQVKARLDRLGERRLLFTPYVTAKIAKECRKLGIPFLDAAGNAYLREPGLLVYVTGEKLEGLVTKPMGARVGGTATALRVVFALLCKPALLNAPYRDLVETANVALGAIGRVFIDLEERGYVAGRQQTKTRRFLEPRRLVEEWVTTYPMRLRPKLHPRRFRPENPDWWKKADLAGLQAYWGGEIAAHRLTNYLKPATCTLYIQPEQDHGKNAGTLARLVMEHHLRADPHGAIEILDAFWRLPPDQNHPDVVPPLLAYADLIATLDPRNLEAAEQVRKKFIDDALRKT